MVLAGLISVGALPIASPASARSSTDGRIAFFDFNAGQIFAVNPDGSGLAQLSHTDARHHAVWPNWTPDGRITFSLIRARGFDDHARIWIMNADGSDPHKLAIEKPGFRDYQSNVTPDGKHIVFSRCLPDDGVCAIWIMNMDGTHKQPLTPFHVGQHEAVDFFPAVSPDGQHVAFTRFGWRGIAAQTYEVGIDGSDERPVTPRSLEAAAPRYSPDGTTLTVTDQFQHFGNNIYTIHLDGSDLTRLTETSYPNSDFQSTYSPSGGEIAFGSDRRYDDFCCVDLFVMEADGDGEVQVPTGDLQGIVQVTWGTPGPLTPTATSASISPPDPAARASVRAWCLSRPAFMRSGIC